MTIFWLSFCSEKSDEKEAFLGACYIEAKNDLDAVRKTHELKINPGGQVLIMPIPPLTSVPSKYMNKLLSIKEIQDIDEEFTGKRPSRQDYRDKWEK